MDNEFDLDEFGLNNNDDNNNKTLDGEDDELFGGYMMSNKTKEKQPEEAKKPEKQPEQDVGDYEDDYEEDFDDIPEDGEDVDQELDAVEKELQELEEQEKQKEREKQEQEKQKQLEKEQEKQKQLEIEKEKEEKQKVQFKLDENEESKQTNQFPKFSNATNEKDTEKERDIFNSEQNNNNMKEIDTIEQLDTQAKTTDLESESNVFSKPQSRIPKKKIKKKKEPKDSVELQTQTGADNEVVIVKRNYVHNKRPQLQEQEQENKKEEENQPKKVEEKPETPPKNIEKQEEIIEDTLNVEEEIESIQNLENEIPLKNDQQTLSKDNSFMGKESRIEENNENDLNIMESQEQRQKTKESSTSGNEIYKEQKSENMEYQDLLEDMQNEKQKKQKEEDEENELLDPKSMKNLSFQERNMMQLKLQQKKIQNQRKIEAEQKHKRENQFRIHKNSQNVSHLRKELKEHPIQKSVIEDENTKVQNIKVMLRVRPLINYEIRGESVCEVENQKVGEKLQFIDRQEIKENKYYKVFGPMCTQKDVFGEVKCFIGDVLNGYNFTILAYGQTGSGKTYTMFGADWESVFSQNKHNHHQHHKNQQTLLEDVENDENFAGIIPRMFYELFDQLDHKIADQNKNFNVYCSFYQIYNEKIYDLLTDNEEELLIRQNRLDGLFIDGLAEFKIIHFLESLKMIKRGEKNRKIRETFMNTKSSRSHTVLQISVEEIDENNMFVKKSRINLCDLAGSEKINKAEVMSNEHLRELQNINQSLTTLGKVIHRLSHKTKLPIPYRESKLTRILQESLSGNAVTLVLGNLSPSIYNLSETLSTLKFVERAQHIKLKVKQNQVDKSENLIVHKLQKEIQYLKGLLAQKRQGNYQEVQITEEIKIRLMRLEDENEILRRETHGNAQIQQIISENNRLKKQLKSFVQSNTNIDRENSSRNYHEQRQNMRSAQNKSQHENSVHFPPIDQNNNKKRGSISKTQENESRIKKNNNLKVQNESQLSQNNNNNNNNNNSQGGSPKIENSSIFIRKERYRGQNNSIDSVQRLKHTKVQKYEENHFQIRVKGQNNNMEHRQIVKQSLEDKRNKEVKRILERLAYMNQAQKDNKVHLNEELKRLEDDHKDFGNNQSSYKNLQNQFYKYQQPNHNNSLFPNESAMRNKSYNSNNTTQSQKHKYNSSNSKISVYSSKNKPPKKPYSQMTPAEKHQMRMLKFQKDMANLEARFK